MAELQVSIPQELENLQLPSPELKRYYEDVAERVYYIEDEIGEELMELSKEIIRINREDSGIDVDKRMPIKIFIDSPGGDVNAMWSFIKLMKISKTPIWTINMCCSYSAAAEILIGGHRRFALPGTSVLIHSGSCCYGGTQEQAESMKKFYDKVLKKATESLIERTKIDPKIFKKKAPYDWYMDEEEALENGVIDEIITDLDSIFQKSQSFGSNAKDA